MKRVALMTPHRASTLQNRYAGNAFETAATCGRKTVFLVNTVHNTCMRTPWASPNSGLAGSELSKQLFLLIFKLGLTIKQFAFSHTHAALRRIVYMLRTGLSTINVENTENPFCLNRLASSALADSCSGRYSCANFKIINPKKACSPSFNQPAGQSGRYYSVPSSLWPSSVSVCGRCARM